MTDRRMMLDPGLFGEYQLARELRMTVGEMRQKMTHIEYLEWFAFFKRLRAEEQVR